MRVLRSADIDAVVLYLMTLLLLLLLMRHHCVWLFNDGQLLTASVYLCFCATS